MVWPALLAQAGLALLGSERQRADERRQRAVDDRHALNERIGSIEDARDARLGRGQYGRAAYGGAAPKLSDGSAGMGALTGVLGAALMAQPKASAVDPLEDDSWKSEPIESSGLRRSTEDDLDEALGGLDGYLATRGRY